MGVTGLWRLIEPAGKPVPVETLENKVLAVDISIWLHQMVKGYQDAKGAPLPNAHLMGLFQRLCKLLYFRIKPVFVFDGVYPELKKETIAKRQDSKAKYNSVSERLKRELALLSLKKTAIHSILEKQVSPKKGNNPNTTEDDIFKLPALPEIEGNESESEEESSTSSIVDLHTVDIESDKFKSLSTKEKYDLLVELKETRKMNSWGKLHELPKKSDNFSDFQMKRLLKRRKVQECLEETEKEMGDSGMSLNELESLLNETGIDTKIENNYPTKRIASDENTRFLLINNVRQALANAKKRRLAENEKANVIELKKVHEKDDIKHENKEEVDEDLEMAIKMSMECVDQPNSNSNTIKTKDCKVKKKGEFEEDMETAIKMSLECVEGPSTSANSTKTDDSWTSFIETDSYSDSEDEEGFMPPDMTSAKAYIMQYSDFTHKAIDNLISSKVNGNKKKKGPCVNKIIEDINKEASVIIDKVDLSSDDEVIEGNLQNIKNNNTDQSIAEIDLDTSPENSISQAKDINTTQSSVICIESTVPNVIELDSSIENSNSKQMENIENQKHDTDSEDDFEVVPEIKSKTVVEVVLNTDEVSGDDIFADVFTNRNEQTLQNVTERKYPTIDQDENKFSDVKIPTSKIAMLHKTDSIPINLQHIKSTNMGQVNLVDRQVPDNMSANLNKNITNEDSSVISITANTTTKSNKDIMIQTVVPVSNDKIPNSGQELNSEATAQKINAPMNEQISKEQLNNMVEEIQVEQQDLLQEKGRLDRVGRNITEQMTKEAQELLQIFGIPYIVAPMEAEAQCAFLESIKLTDGTITDDSDIWLFGGRTVYKNFFNHKKHVLQFLADRIEKSFNLNREQLILLALLVGSDYTTGVAGVGPVTAMEILASFPLSKKLSLKEDSKQERYINVLAGLKEFKQWVKAGKRTDNSTLKKKLRNVELTDDFPSLRVVQAYLDPNVEKSDDKFTWGQLDITILRDYTRTKFGWSQNKLDEIIKPVLKRVSEQKSQRNIQDYFQRKIEFQALDDQMSKRVKAAVKKMGPEAFTEEANDKNAIKKRRNVKKRNSVKDVDSEAGPSKLKQRKEEDVINEHCVKVVNQVKDVNLDIEIKIPKTDRFQETIPQREKDKKSMLENKLKAIELFRKTNIDRKRKITKRKIILPKEKAELSESDSD